MSSEKKDVDLHEVARQADGLVAVLDTKPIEDEVTVGVAATKTLKVVDAETYETAAQHLVGFATLKKRIEKYFADDVSRAHKLWLSLTGKRKTALDAVDGEIARIKRAMSIWSTEEERQRLADERKASREAQQRERERVEAEAALLAQQGHVELAEAVRTEAITAPPPVVLIQSSVPKVAGVSTAEAWDYEVVDESLLTRKYLMRNDKAIRADVNVLKGLARIPGVRVFRADQVRVRAT